MLPPPAASRRPSSSRVRSASATRSAAPPRCTTWPGVEHDHRVGDAPHERKVLLDEQDRGGPRNLGQHVGDLGDQLRGQALGRLVDEQQDVVRSSTLASETICCWPPERVPARCLRAGDEVGEEPAHDGRLHTTVRVDEAQVLVDGEAAEDLPVLGDVANAAADDPCRRRPWISSALAEDPAGARGRPMIALSVVVLPTPLRPSSAVTPRRGHVEGRHPAGRGSRRSGRGGLDGDASSGAGRGGRRSQGFSQVGLLDRSSRGDLARAHRRRAAGRGGARRRGRRGRARRACGARPSRRPRPSRGPRR